MKIKKWNGTTWVQKYPEVDVGSIVATGITNFNFLRGDGVWATPTNNFLSSVFGGTGNSTISFARSGLSTLSINLAHNHDASQVTSGTFADARIPNLDASKITAGTVNILRIPLGSVAGNASSSFWNPQNTSIAKFSSGVGWFTTTENGSIYSSNALFIKRIWKKGATESNFTTVFNAGTGTGTQISVNATFTQINLNYTGSDTDMYMIEFSNNSNNNVGKGVAHIGSGTFQSTAGMAVISYDAYETVTGTGQLQIAKYFAQVQRQQVGSSAALGFRYASKVRIV